MNPDDKNYPHAHLEPCPFCGAPGQLDRSRFLFWCDFDVFCVRCDATVGANRTNSESEAVKRWNARRVA